MTDTREKGRPSEYLIGRIYKYLSQVMRRDIAYWQCLVMSLNNPTHTMHNQPFIIFRTFIVDCTDISVLVRIISCGNRQRPISK